MASIYELTADIQKLYDLLDKGELDEEMVRDAILNTEEEIGIKLDNYECFIKNLESDIKGLKEEEKRLKERRQSYENTVAEMKDAMGGRLSRLRGKTKSRRASSHSGFRRTHLLSSLTNSTSRTYLKPISYTKNRQLTRRSSLLICRRELTSKESLTLSRANQFAFDKE